MVDRTAFGERVGEEERDGDQALETMLGRPLFERRPRGVRPTTAGDELVRRVGEPIDAVHGPLCDELSPPAATVHLGGPADFLCRLALPAHADLARA